MVQKGILALGMSENMEVTEMKWWVRVILTAVWVTMHLWWVEMRLTRLYPKEEIWVIDSFTQFVRLLLSRDLLSWLVCLVFLAILAFIWLWRWKQLDEEITAMSERYQ